MSVGFSAGARLFRQIGQDFAQSPGGGDALRERQTEDCITASEVESVRIEACHAPRTVLGAKQLRRVKTWISCSWVTMISCAMRRSGSLFGRLSNPNGARSELLPP
jgi:hypothetical protein